MNNKAIRIAQVMGKMNSGGVESVVMNYYRNIDKNKIQFDFIVDEDSYNIPKEEIENLGGKIILVPPYKNIVSYTNSLRAILKKSEYKIIHSHLNTLSLVPLYVAKISNVPVRIAHSHSTSNKKEWKKNIVKNVLKSFSKINATDYYCCSELAGRWLFGDKAYENNEVKLINNAIDVDRFIYNEEIRNKIRKELDIEDKLVIGHVGRFVEQKNHAGLIDIFDEIYKLNSQSVLLLAGEGPLLDQIKDKVENLNLSNYVKFLGVRNDIDKIMQAIDVFLLPSLYEGLPVVGVEAQASGALCILSSCMTKETKVLETTKFFNIFDKSEEIARYILNQYNKFERKNVKEEIINSNFEIRTESKKLETEYLKLYKRVIR